MKKNECIAFTGGGTAGHIFPGLAVAEILKKDLSCRMIWIGSRDKKEKNWLKGTGVKYYSIFCGKWRRYFSLKNILDIVKIFIGSIQAFLCLLKEKPKILFSKGGYVSVTPVLAARLLGITIFTHESDLDPGIATKINALSAYKILTSFDNTIKYFPIKYRNKVIFTGNPVREGILKGNPDEGKKIIGCNNNKPVLLILGGSLGARSLNTYITKIVGILVKKYFVVHQMGMSNYMKSNVKDYYTVPFFTTELSHVFAASSLVISRAGANTLSELAVLGKPAILVPLSALFSRGDQIRNAGFFSDKGSAVIFKENENSETELLEIISKLLDNKKMLKAMEEQMLLLGRPKAAQNIAQLIKKEIYGV